MKNWKFIATKKIKYHNPILIEGLPGVGNVGKVAVDFLIDDMKAQKIGEFRSNQMPITVFLNEQDEVEMPNIELFHKNIKNKDILFLSGDMQPLEEESCHDFCETLLDEIKAKEIITLGGIAKKEEPKEPKVYCMGTEKKHITEFKKGTKISNKAHKSIGPIIGVTGLLIGMARRRKEKGIMLLAETDEHPFHLGITAAKEILKILKEKLNIKVNLKNINKDMETIEEDLKKITAELIQPKKKKEETRYIG